MTQRRREPGLDSLVSDHATLVRTLARRFARPGVALEDLEQAAYEGLIKAAHGFDADRGTPFGAFAVATMVGELKRNMRFAAWPAHVPRPVKERAVALRAARAALETETGRTPDATALAARLGWDPETVVEALTAAASMRAASLEDGDHEGTPFGERFGALDPGFEEVEERVAIEAAMPELTARQRRALRMRFADELTLAEIAERLAVPRGQAARIVHDAIARLQALTSTPTAA